jgi:hypothetical protein
MNCAKKANYEADKVKEGTYNSTICNGSKSFINPNKAEDGTSRGSEKMNQQKIC